MQLLAKRTSAWYDNKMLDKTLATNSRIILSLIRVIVAVKLMILKRRLKQLPDVHFPY